MLEDERQLATITREEIENGFKQFGIKQGAILEVHSSLSAFGKVKGGAMTVINALKQSVGENGTIVMSAYPITPAVPLTEEEQARGITWKTKVISEDSPERTGMGVIPDTFKRLPDVVCGHGKHKVAAWGNEAEKHAQGYKYLLEKDGYVLLMGVCIDRTSSMHIGEEVPIPKQVEQYFEVPEDIKKDYPSDQWSVGFGNGTPDNAWQKVFKKADEQGLIKHVKIGNAECHLFKAKDLVSMFAEWRSQDPYGLYGVSREEVS